MKSKGETRAEQPKCSCAQFDRLDGASVPAYIKAFLEQTNPSTSNERNRYRCRVCGSEWKRRTPITEGQAKRPSLVRLCESRMET